MKKIMIINTIFCLLTLNAFSQSRLSDYMEQAGLAEGAFNSIQDNQPDTLPDNFQVRGDTKKVALFYGKGTWFFGKRHLKNFLYSYQRSFRVITENDILSGALNSGEFHTLIMPGGKSWIYLDNLGPKGAVEIAKFVSSGGNYMGICAGAYYATSLRQGPAKTPTNYGIGLLNGIAYDGTALRTPPFRSGMMNFDVLIPGFPSTYRILLLGGPSFYYTEQEANLKKIKVLSLFAPQMPAMITFEFGKGHVFLSGPHGEVEENKSILRLRYNDPDSEWPIIDYVFKNYFKNTK